MEADFSGYATKAGLKCSDGRTITPEAFKNQDKMTVPLVWQHGHSDAKNVLGHVDLEARGDGIYSYGFFNSTEQGQNAKQLVEHGDVKSLSIWANDLVEKSKIVVHGVIREVSLVLSGANPGALIDYVRVAHSDDPDDVSVLADEAIITTGLELEHSQKPPVAKEKTEEKTDDKSDDNLEHAKSDGPTVKEIIDGMTDDQKAVINILITAAVAEAKGEAAHSNLGPDAEPQAVYDAFSDAEKAVVHDMIEAAKKEASTAAVAEHSALTNQEGTTVNVFESQGQAANTLQHAQMVEARKKFTPEVMESIMKDASKTGSYREAFIAHAAEYGIENIDLLFPNPAMDGNGVTLLSRRMEWVANVLASTHHSPFSRIKSLSADITAEEARARGYVKGTQKKDEIIKMLRRITTPKTIYKKQKLDRDDIVDITDLDIVAWLKAEMRVMLDEELARAILVGDNRPADDPDKIDEDHIRPVAYDIDMYTTKVNLATDISPTDLVDAVVNALNKFKGTGTPTLYTTLGRLTSMLLAKDTLGRRLYPTKADLANALLVKDVVAVEAMEVDTDLVGVIVNLADYTVGADSGGQISMFDFFDIDFNQQKYLIETRVSGALTRPKSAVALFVNSGRIVTPQVPTFNTATGVLTVPSQTGVVYHNTDTGATLSSGAQTAIASGATIDVDAAPANGYGFTHDADFTWAFTRD